MKRTVKQIIAILLVAVMVLTSGVLLNDGVLERVKSVFPAKDEPAAQEADAPLYSEEDRADLEALAAIVLGESAPEELSALSDRELLSLVEERIGPVGDPADEADKADEGFKAPSVDTLEAAAGVDPAALADTEAQAADPVEVTPEVREEYFNEENEIVAPYDEIFPEAVEEGLVPYAADTLLIKVAGGKEPLSAAVKAAGGAKAEKMFDIGADTWYELKLAEGTDALAAVNAIRESGDVRTAELNFEVKADALDAYAPVADGLTGNTEVGSQWALNHFGIPAGLAHMQNPGGSRSVVVAVIDTGADYGHEDLVNNIWTNPNEIPGNGRDDDGNGYTDDYYGWDFVNRHGRPMDDNGHGTHVAGVIGAVNNNLGVVGVAYNVKLMILKAADSTGSFTQANIASAIIYAYQNGAEVINMSFGSTSITSAVQDALQVAYGRCVLVASAGNDGKPADTHPNYPAALSYVLGVMSIGRDGTPSVFTNRNAGRGRRGCSYELYAPGESVLSTIPGNKYASWSGTSMAAPFIAAFAALLRSEFADRELYTVGFIYGQLINASQIAPEGGEGPVAPDLYEALTELPEPDLYVSAYSMFDTAGFAQDTDNVNNGDGVLDAGETAAAGLTLKNRWGRADETVVSVSVDDEYVTLHTESVSFGGVGTYASKDSGKVIEGDLQTAWESPVYFTVSPACPNNHEVKLNLTITCKNAYSEEHETYTFTDSLTFYVRAGKVISGLISEDQTWTPENLYIITNSTTIQAGATVRVLPGTQIQFWTNDPTDPYRDNYMVYLKVEGQFLVEGTEEAPVKIFPSDLMQQYVVNIGEAGSGYVSIDHAEITNLNDGNISCCISYIGHSTLKKQSMYSYYRYLKDGKVLSTYFNDKCFYFGNNYSTQTYRYFYTFITRISEMEACDVSYSQLAVSSNCSVSDSTFHGTIGIYGNFKKCIFYGTTYLKGTAENCIFYRNNIMCYSGCDTCAFIDCCGKLDVDYRYTNCVFYGNNSFSNGTPSTATLAYNAKAVRFAPENNVSYVYNPANGSTYVRINAGAYDGSGSSYASPAFAWEEELFALGWDYAAIETPEEYSFLSASSIRGSGTQDSSFNVGAFVQDGVLYWHNGMPLGDFINYSNTSHRYLYLCGATALMYNYAPLAWLFEIPGPVYITEITPLDSYVKLDTGETYQIRVNCEPGNVPIEEMHFESADESVATVSETGVVTPVGVGKTKIAIFAPDKGAFTYMDVEVIEDVALTGLTLSAPQTMLNIGESMDLTVTLTPADTSKRNITFTSSDPSILTVDAYGRVTAVGRGAATVTAACGDIQDSITLRGTRQITSIAYDTASANMVYNSNYYYNDIRYHYHLSFYSDQEYALPQVNLDQNCDFELDWSADKEGILQIRDGKLATLAAGTVMLTVTDTISGKKASIPAEVKAKAFSLPANGLVLYTDNGWAERPEVTLTPGSEYDLTWRSSDESVLLERGGRLLPVNPGVASLTVTDAVSGRTAKMPVFVSDAVNETKIVKMRYGYDYINNKQWNTYYALYDDGSLWYWTDLTKPPQLWYTDVKDFDCSDNWYIILKTDGSITVSHDASYWDPETRTYQYISYYLPAFAAAHRVKAVFCGVYVTEYAALTEDGRVYAWGNNNNAMLGIGSSSSTPIPTLVNLENVTGVYMYANGSSYQFTWFLTADGTLYRAGGSDYIPSKQGEGFEALFKISNGYAYALKNGNWYGLSDNLDSSYSYSQRADADTVPRWSLEDGVVYGQYSSGYSYVRLPDLTNATGVFYANGWFVAAADGGLYRVAIDYNRPPYISSTVCPAGVQIQPFAAEKHNVFDGLLYDTAVTVDFNAVLERVNYRLYENGVQIPCSYNIDADQVSFTVSGGFKSDAAYELKILSDGTAGAYLYALPADIVIPFTLAPADAEKPADTACAHPYENLVHTGRVPATCTENGATPGVTCTLCEQILGGLRPLEALGHSLIAHPASPATCTETGWDVYYTCTRCDYTSYYPLDPLGHAYTVERTKEPTCTEDGEALLTCDLCGESHTEALPALGHTAEAGEITTAPTCTEAGVETLVCDVCGESFTRPVPALGHTLNEGEVTEAPTCEEDGARTRVCESCGETVTETVPALGHDWTEYFENPAASCTAEGTFTRVCGRCPAEQSYTVPALGHDMDEGTETAAPTCAEAGEITYACSRCDYVETEAIPALGHDMDEGTETAAPTCTEAGQIVYACSRCDYTETETAEALGHSWALTETLADPSCTEDGLGVYTCERCGETKEEAIPAPGHEAVITAAKEPTCTESGWAQYTTCARCGETDFVLREPLGHDLVQLTQKAPTCTNIGYTAYEYCTRCDYRTENEIFAVDPEAHVWDAGYITLKLSESIYGEKTYTCLEDPSHVRTENELDSLEITVYETTIDETVERHFWDLEEIVAAATDAVEATRRNPYFINNTVINRLTADTDVSHWLRVLAPSVSEFTEYYLGGNYWGTENAPAIDLQILDYNDFTDYAQLAYRPYLTAVPESTFPVVTDIRVTNADGNEITLASNEEITVTVSFSRDMDTETPVEVSFGWRNPFDQVSVIGSFTDSRTWVGTVRITANVESGIQYFAVTGGKAADEDLMLIPDTMRFFFTVDTTSAQALIMQGAAEDNGVTLTWEQDDFDTLMGYNVYRSTSLNGYYTRLNTSVIPADVKTFFDDTVEPGMVYYYNFTVVKTDLTESTPSGKIVIMSKDTMAPNIYHTPVYDAFTGSNLILSATVTDNISVSAVMVHYRTVGAAEWKTAVMNRLNDKYSVIIPADQITVDGIEYYIEATDGVSASYKGSAENPYVITVREALDDSAVGDVNGDGRINNLDALMIIQAINDMINLDAEQFARADLNGDGELTAAEALRILQYVSGAVGSVKM